jgi:monoamine oxidase
VSSIDYSGEKVVIRDRNGIDYECDKVLVTVPIGVLQSQMIAFNPAMDAKKVEAIQSISFPTGFKVAMKFSDKFYPDVINLKGIGGENVYYDIAFKKEANAHILGYLCLGEQAKTYEALASEKAIVNKLLEQLDTMYDGKASELYTGEYRFENWGKHEYTQGTWTQAYQEKKSTLKTLAEPLDSKVYFAGEIFDPYQQMGVPGALLSGFHSVDKMLGAIEGARKKF